MIGGSKLEIQREKLSPMMQHYLATKEKYPDCILFYRLGDFYEMFFDDAIKVSRELELTLTGRDCGLPERAPMCGVPYHSVSGRAPRCDTVHQCAVYRITAWSST